MSQGECLITSLESILLRVSTIKPTVNSISLNVQAQIYAVVLDLFIFFHYIQSFNNFCWIYLKDCNRRFVLLPPQKPLSILNCSLCFSHLHASILTKACMLIQHVIIMLKGKSDHESGL